MRRTVSAILLSATLAFIAVVIPVLAQDFSFGLRPEDQSIAYFRYTLASGESLSDAVLAVNGTKNPLRLVVSRVGGHTALTGGVSFPGEADGPAQWLSLPDEGVHEVPAGLAIRLPFTLKVPEGTPPGEYVAGFLATPEDPSSVVPNQGGGGGLNVQVIPQMGVTMIITVPGPERCEVTIRSIADEIDKGGWKLSLLLANTGNIHFKGQGSFVLRPAAGGDPSMERPFPLGYFVAGDEIPYPLYFDTPPAAGEYLAEVTLRGDECVYETTYSQPITFSSDQAAFAEEEAKRWAEAAQVTSSPSQEDELLKNIQTLGIATFGLVVAAILGLAAFLILTQRRRKQHGVEIGPRDIRPAPKDRQGGAND